MALGKRFFFFFLVNILVMVTVSLVLNFLGVSHYATAYGINYQQLMIFCLVWGMAGSFISLMLSKFMAKSMMGVEIVDGRGQYHQLVQSIHHLSRRAGISKMPEVGIYHSPDINAFATGPTKNSALIAVSTGLLQNMSWDEIEGVLAHEVSHAANGDMVTMTLIQGVINAFVMFFARIAAFFVAQALRSNDNEGRGGSRFFEFILIFLFEIIFGLFGMMVVALFSRWREFRADAGSAALVGREKMIAALRKLQRTYEVATEAVKEEPKSFAAFKISGGRSGFMQLLSTHPSLDARIKALQESR